MREAWNWLNAWCDEYENKHLNTKELKIMQHLYNYKHGKLGKAVFLQLPNQFCKRLAG